MIRNLEFFVPPHSMAELVLMIGSSREQNPSPAPLRGLAKRPAATRTSLPSESTRVTSLRNGFPSGIKGSQAATFSGKAMNAFWAAFDSSNALLLNLDGSGAAYRMVSSLETVKPFDAGSERPVIPALIIKKN